MDLKDFNTILKKVPDYQTFLTVDELTASTHKLAEKYPETVEIIPVGYSRAGDLIETVKIGDGPKTALLFAMPHPNEPIGSMMLETLSHLLAEDNELRASMGYTWYLIKCIDPDGTRLNEGWFKGPFSITNYGTHYYRPPSHQQIEWTFPIEYKSLNFSNPLPETKALMTLIEEKKPDFIYSLHNAGFGGAYFYISEEATDLYTPFYDLVRSQGLSLHLGEPEAPWMDQFTDAIFQAPAITQAYDFLEKQGADPAKAITGGTSSFDYAKLFCDPFTLICEMPYFENAAIHDTSPSDEVRRDVILAGLKKVRVGLDTISEIYEGAKEELTAPSPFVDSVSSFTKTLPQNLTAQENWAKTDPKTEKAATVAEKFDNLVVKRFYMGLLMMGMTVRMIEHQISATGPTPLLSSSLEKAVDAFKQISTELENEMDYTVIPIRKLVNVQLGSALLAASYAAGR